MYVIMMVALAIVLYIGRLYIVYIFIILLEWNLYCIYIYMHNAIILLVPFGRDHFWFYFFYVDFYVLTSTARPHISWIKKERKKERKEKNKKKFGI